MSRTFWKTISKIHLLGLRVSDGIKLLDLWDIGGTLHCCNSTNQKQIPTANNLELPYPSQGDRGDPTGLADSWLLDSLWELLAVNYEFQAKGSPNPLQAMVRGLVLALNRPL